MSLPERIKNGDLESIKELVLNGKITKEDIMKPNNNGNTPLLWASMCGHLDIIKYMKEEFEITKEDIMKPDNDGFTSILLASRNGHLDIIKYLKEMFEIMTQAGRTVSAFEDSLLSDSKSDVE